MATRERWRPVVGYEGYYEVSDLGRVRSLGRWRSNGNTLYWLKPRIMRASVPKRSRSYPAVRLYHPRKKAKRREVHALVLHAFRGPPPRGMLCRHLDGTNHNNVLVNIVWGTRKENAADAIHHGVHPRGDKAGTAKLTVTDVMAIRAACSAGTKQRDVAAQYNVCQSSISHIINKKSWSHI